MRRLLRPARYSWRARHDSNVRPLPSEGSTLIQLSYGRVGDGFYYNSALCRRSRASPEEHMSGHHAHHDPIEDNIETHPVKLAVGIVIGAVALVIGIVLMAQLAIGFYGARSMKDEAAMSEAAVAK